MKSHEVPVPFRYDWEVMAPTGFLLDHLSEKYAVSSVLSDSMQDVSMHAVVQRGADALPEILEHGLTRNQDNTDIRFGHEHYLATHMIATQMGETIPYKGHNMTVAFLTAIRWLEDKKFANQHPSRPG